jgi:bifunctional non-homologous end joining protein LigD
MSSRRPFPRPLPPGFIAPCLPTASDRCKSGPEWVHEIKHDGYRLIARRSDDRVRLYTRRGFNWADRHPHIVDALRSLHVLYHNDGEAVWCGKVASQILTSCTLARMTRASFSTASTLSKLNGEDLRPPLEQRKGKLEKLLARNDGMRFSEHHDGDGAIVFKHACKLGLEGIVSMRLDLAYRSGRCRAWIKIKNPASPAMLRIQDGTW